jgi:hypothetical protein
LSRAPLVAEPSQNAERHGCGALTWSDARTTLAGHTLGVVDDDGLVGGSRGMLLRLSGQGWLVARVKIAAGA